jgi:hypothetical protein
MKCVLNTKEHRSGCTWYYMRRLVRGKVHAINVVISDAEMVERGYVAWKVRRARACLAAASQTVLA